MVEHKRGGSIINLASIGGIVASPSIRYSGYGAAKAGIINFTLTAAQYLGKYDIRINAIAPGRMDTESSSQAIQGDIRIRETNIKLIPLKRLGLPQDIGRVAVFLASEASSYITGQTIIVSGGLTHLSPLIPPII
jgi:3-oxoacyl-[acyl-carrier protein] reductase